jgi:hypothetical protein
LFGAYRFRDERLIPFRGGREGSTAFGSLHNNLAVPIGDIGCVAYSDRRTRNRLAGDVGRNFQFEECFAGLGNGLADEYQEQCNRKDEAVTPANSRPASLGL